MDRALGRPIEILMVEDNPGDIELTIEALQDAKVRNNLHAVQDGMEALEYLYKRGPYSDATRPDVIFLDLNLPKKDGRDVLAEIKQDEELGRIPVIVLTTSDAEEDILRSYDLDANCYITKPVNFEQFVNVVKTIEEFWFTVVTLPSKFTESS